MLAAFATLVSESSSAECSLMNFRAFQISTGSARWPSRADWGNRSVAAAIIVPYQATAGVVRLFLYWHCLVCSWRGAENNYFSPEQFLQSKSQSTQSTKPIVALLKPIKELVMEYVILVAVVSMMALYALIIVGCLKQPEW